MASLLDRNLDAMSRLSPVASDLIRRATPRSDVRTVQSATGCPLIEVAGQPLDSRRDPVRAAASQAGGAAGSPVVLAGLGAGYLLEQLVAHDVEVGAVVDHDPAVLRAALESRDLTAHLSRIPLVVVAELRDAVALARLRRRGRYVVAQGAVVAASPELTVIVREWANMKVAARRPRVMVAGPIYGGSLEVARSVARASEAFGADTRLVDASIFGEAHASLRGRALPESSRSLLLGRLTEVAAELIVHEAQQWKPDLLLALAQAPLAQSAIEALKKGGVATAFWFVENHRVLTYWREIARHYDWFYAIQPADFIEQLAEAGAAHPRYLPMACDPARHRAVALSVEEQARFGADVSFAGATYHNRGRLFAALMDFDIKLWGPDWGGPGFGHKAGDGGREFSLEEMIRIFSGTRVNLNVHSANHVSGLDPEPDYVNPRTFELASCGAFQLVDWRSPLADLFAPDEMVTFRNVGELRSLIPHYLAHEDERRAIAARARARAHADHTYLDRIGTILRDALPPSLVARAMDDEPGESLDEALSRLCSQGQTLTDEEALIRTVRAMLS